MPHHLTDRRTIYINAVGIANKANTHGPDRFLQWQPSAADLSEKTKVDVQNISGLETIQKMFAQRLN